MNAGTMNDEERRRLASALAADGKEEITAQEIKTLLARELEKDEAHMDAELVDACCAALCELNGREQLCADTPEEMPASLRRRLRRIPIRRRAVRLGVRAIAAAACVTLVLFAADVWRSHRLLRITQSPDEQQAMVDFQKRGGSETVSHAGANADNPFDRIYLAPSLDALWQYAGYTLPLPETLPAGLRAVRAYMLPISSVDMITVRYENDDGAYATVQYWYDESREQVLLGYEQWYDRMDVPLESGNTVMRFPETDASSGVLHAAFVATHLTCALESEHLTETDFAALLESMGAMEASAPPVTARSDADDPLAHQARVTEYAPPQLHFYDLADMEACVRRQVPLPEDIPGELSFVYGTYLLSDTHEMIHLTFETGDGRDMGYSYDVYGSDAINIGVEQNEEGRFVTLSNGVQAYIACNVDRPFGLITGQHSMVSVYFTGYDEQTLLCVMDSIANLPADF